MARAAGRTRAQRPDSEAVLPGTRTHAVVFLRLAQTAARTRAGTFRISGERTCAAGTCSYGGVGTATGNGRAAAYWRRRGRRHIAHGARGVAGMIHLPASVRVYLCLAPCDMRRSFDGLHALVREHLELNAFAGHLFVFASRRRDRIKILYWDRDGFALWSKRLEEGTYAVPFGEDAERCQREITAQELGALLSGIDLQHATRRKRYQRS